MNSSSDSTKDARLALVATAAVSVQSRSGQKESQVATSGHEHNILFVYGTLKRGFHNHHLLGSSSFVGEATIPGTMRSLGGFPCVSLNGDYQVHGELFSVSDEILSDCDRLEGHPGWYERKMVNTSKGPAWVYVIEDERYTQYPIVKTGKWYDDRAQTN